MQIDATPVLDTLCDADHDAARLYGEAQAEMQALRFALVRSILRDPENVEAREPLWIALYALKRECAWRLDWVRHALNVGLDAIDRDAAFHGADAHTRSGDAVCRVPVERPDGSTDWISTARLHPGLHCGGPVGWLPGDAEPADERVRLLDLSS